MSGERSRGRGSEAVASYSRRPTWTLQSFLHPLRPTQLHHNIQIHSPTHSSSSSSHPTLSDVRPHPLQPGALNSFWIHIHDTSLYTTRYYTIYYYTISLCPHIYTVMDIVSTIVLHRQNKTHSLATFTPSVTASSSFFSVKQRLQVPGTRWRFQAPGGGSRHQMEVPDTRWRFQASGRSFRDLERALGLGEVCGRSCDLTVQADPAGRRENRTSCLSGRPSANQVGHRKRLPLYLKV